MRTGFTVEETNAILAEHYPWACKIMKIIVEQNILDEYEAVDDDTFDGPGSPVGRGKTEAEAIEDLKEQLNN